jgi:glycosyltransferase involved in cell wall biosynthesis
VSLIIPTLNEADNLPLILPYIPMDVVDEVILVDGRSTDNTIEVSRQIMPSIKLVMEEKPGKGAALAAGFKASSGDIIIVMDADGSNDPREIPRFIHALREGADFVKGSRFASGGGTTDMPRIRRLGNSGFVLIVNLLFNGTFTDLCYGYHAFWRYCLNTLDLKEVDGFEVDTALYLRAMQMSLKIMEVPSFEGYRFYGVGKLRTIPDGLRVLRTIFSEFIMSLRISHRDLPVGFRGQPVEYRETFNISIMEDNYPSRRDLLE